MATRQELLELIKNKEFNKTLLIYPLSKSLEIEVCMGIVADAEMDTWKKSDSELEEIENLEGYIWTIVKHKTWSIIYKIKKTPPLGRNEDINEAKFKGFETDPGIKVDYDKLLEFIRKKKGSPDYEIVTLRNEEYSWKEIGDKIEMEEGAVKTRYSRLRTWLRSNYQQ